jgi:feruloyl esterase
MWRSVLAGISWLVLSSSALAQTPEQCARMAALSLTNTGITLAEIVPAGAFIPPGAPPGTPNTPYRDLPAFCRIAATLAPTADSHIRVEVWLPMSNWNGKFQAVGNGGWAGSITYSSGFGGMERGMAEALRRGYAASSTDTGHPGNTAAGMLGRPEKLTDFAYRSVHEMTVHAKLVINAFYGRGPRFSYWNGCSTGGRQGLMEAQRFPDDFDGIIAGAPADNTDWLARMLVAHANLKNPASFIPATKYPAVHRAVINACDSIDGLRDGLIDDPRQCTFDPKTIECTEGDGPACLTTLQVETARLIVSPIKNLPGGRKTTLSLEHGTELGWAVPAGGPEPSINTLDYLKYVVFKDAAWDWRTFDFTRDVARVEQTDDPRRATDPNLRAFFSGGGKLLLYHGWSDPNVPPRSTVHYYTDVVNAVGGGQPSSESVRLFMLPGMAHCGGGDGPNAFDAIGALEQWVEQGRAPDRIIGSHGAGGKIDRTRPLCPYPQVARYKGSGSIDEAENFVCRAP